MSVIWSSEMSVTQGLHSEWRDVGIFVKNVCHIVDVCY